MSNTVTLGIGCLKMHFATVGAFARQAYSVKFAITFIASRWMAGLAARWQMNTQFGCSLIAPWLC